MTGKTFSQGWGSVVVHRDAAAFANISGGTERDEPAHNLSLPPSLQAHVPHIIDRRCAASEGCREHPACGFRRPVEPDDGSISGLRQKN
jgi:hypothetical protein